MSILLVLFRRHQRLSLKIGKQLSKLSYLKSFIKKDKTFLRNNQWIRILNTEKFNRIFESECLKTGKVEKIVLRILELVSLTGRARVLILAPKKTQPTTFILFWGYFNPLSLGILNVSLGGEIAPTHSKNTGLAVENHK